MQDKYPSIKVKKLSKREKNNNLLKSIFLKYVLEKQQRWLETADWENITALYNESTVLTEHCSVKKIQNRYKNIAYRQKQEESNSVSLADLVLGRTDKLPSITTRSHTSASDKTFLLELDKTTSGIKPKMKNEYIKNFFNEYRKDNKNIKAINALLKRTKEKEEVEETLINKKVKIRSSNLSEIPDLNIDDLDKINKIDHEMHLKFPK